MEIKCQSASHGVSRKFSFYSRVRQLQFLPFESCAPLDRKPVLVINDIVINKGASISFGRADSVIGYGGRGPAWDRPLTNWSDGREGPGCGGQYLASGGSIADRNRAGRNGCTSCRQVNRGYENLAVCAFEWSCSFLGENEMMMM